MLTLTPQGLYCPAGDFHIDASRPVRRAIITHAHGDHARPGSQTYLAHHASIPVLRHRLGAGISVQAVEYGEVIEERGVRISLHPAGHIPGSAQVRVERAGEVWVFSGDYKVERDEISEPFEPVRCNTFISEATFGLPLFHWAAQDEVFASMNEWWKGNAAQGRASVIQCYSLGKAQRILKHVDQSIGAVVAHPIIYHTTTAVRAGGIDLPTLVHGGKDVSKATLQSALVLAPPSAIAQGWLKQMPRPSVAQASGWMMLEKLRRRSGTDAAFVLSDHADWKGLCDSILATSAERVLLTHGYSEALARWVTEQGRQGEVLSEARPNAGGISPQNSLEEDE